MQRSEFRTNFSLSNARIRDNTYRCFSHVKSLSGALGLFNAVILYILSRGVVQCATLLVESYLEKIVAPSLPAQRSRSAESPSCMFTDMIAG